MGGFPRALGALSSTMVLRSGPSLGSDRRWSIARTLLLVLVAMPLGACSLFNKSDDLAPDEPADKLTSRINLYKRYLPRIFERDWKFDYSRGNTILVTRNK